MEYIGVDPLCRLDMEQLKAAVDDETVLISIMAVNNETEPSCRRHRSMR